MIARDLIIVYKELSLEQTDKMIRLGYFQSLMFLSFVCCRNVKTLKNPDWFTALERILAQTQTVIHYIYNSKLRTIL